MKEITVPSGASVKIGIADFEHAMALKNAMVRELAETDLKIDFSDLSFDTDIDIGMVVQALLSVDGSAEVHKCLERCMMQSLYNGAKITPQTFNPKDARADYYPIVFAVLEENLLPFFGGLFSKLSEVKGILDKAKSQDENAQKSE